MEGKHEKKKKAIYIHVQPSNYCGGMCQLSSHVYIYIHTHVPSESVLSIVILSYIVL